MMIRAEEEGGVISGFHRGSRHGMEEELSELTGNMVHLFFSPSSPPTTRPPSPPPRGLVGIRNDLAEIGGSFKTGISALSNLLRCSPEKGGHRSGGGVTAVSRVPVAVGVTEDILEFVRFLAGRPEEWLQCPILLDSHLPMSEIRRVHIETIEHLVPSLAALRSSISPSRLSEGSFWKIYFFLLHPRLSKRDSELLSTSQIVEEVDRELQELRNRIIARLESYRTSAPSPTECDKISIQEADSQAQEEVSSNTETTSSWVHAAEHENIDQWLEEDGVLLVPVDHRKQLGSEVSSDREYDDNPVILARHTSSSSLEVAADSSVCSSSEWVPLKYQSRSQCHSNKPVKSTFERDSLDGESSDWVNANDSD